MSIINLLFLIILQANLKDSGLVDESVWRMSGEKVKPKKIKQYNIVICWTSQPMLIPVFGVRMYRFFSFDKKTQTHCFSTEYSFINNFFQFSKSFQFNLDSSFSGIPQ